MARWNGWWKQYRLGRQMMRDLFLDVDSEGTITGGGKDCVGRFTFHGRLQADGSVSLVKQYIGRHRVLYEGRNSGEGIYGAWTIPDAWYAPEFNTGEFALRPETAANESSEAIAEFRPALSTRDRPLQACRQVNEIDG